MDVGSTEFQESQAQCIEFNGSKDTRRIMTLFAARCSQIRLLLLLSEMKNSIKMHTCSEPHNSTALKPENPATFRAREKIESGTNKAGWQEKRKEMKM